MNARVLQEETCWQKERKRSQDEGGSAGLLSRALGGGAMGGSGQVGSTDGGGERRKGKAGGYLHQD